MSHAEQILPFLSSSGKILKEAGISDFMVTLIPENPPCTPLSGDRVDPRSNTDARGAILMLFYDSDRNAPGGETRIPLKFT